MTKENFEVLLKNYPKIILKFTSPFCTSCRMLDKILNPILQDRSILLVTVNIINFPEFAKEYNVSTLPQLIMFKNGQLFQQLPPGIFSKPTLMQYINSLES